MQVRLSVNMLYILVLCRALLAAGVLTLTIDSQLGTSIEDCFERVSIGEQLPSDAIFRNVSEVMTRECEQICKQDKQCQSYDYGVGAKGNATCNLSNLNEKEIKEKNPLRRHPDYDVYIRRFQCEQSPPTPIQPQFDDPGNGPHHRPVFRPEGDDPKRPLSDDYLVSSDLQPYETARPPISPYRPDRPDEYGPGPDNRPPSYGDHKPQDIPYRPERPNNNQHVYQKPDSHDVLQFQGHKPRPDNWRPDPYYPYPVDSGSVPESYGPRPPLQDPYRPEKPNYHYITKPNRKPIFSKPSEDTGYGNNPSKPDPYGQNDLGHPSGPIGPSNRPYRPSKPYEKPSYHGQYASQYGQNSQYDNSIHVEINDPPNPYKPYDRPQVNPSQGIYGYGTYSSQNSYSQSHQSQYSGTITEIANYDPNDPHRPFQDQVGGRPQRPSYGSPGFNQNDQGYGTGYGGLQDDPNSKPSYGSNQALYGSSHGSYGGNKGSYGSETGSYGSSQGSYGGNKGSYGDTVSYGSHQGSYGGDTGSYGSNQGSYGGNKGSYGSDTGSHGSNKGSYGVDKGSYGGNKGSYGSDTGLYGGNKGSYGSGTGSFGGHQGSYEGNKGSYGSDTGTYGGNQGSYGGDTGSYGGNQGSHGGDTGSYGGNKGSYGGNHGSYGSDTGSYGGNHGSYGSDTGSYGVNKGSYGSDTGSYGGNKGTYSSDTGSYGGNKGTYSSDAGSFGGHHGSYGNEQGSHGSNPGSYGSNKGSYSISQSAYNSNQASYGNTSQYHGSKRPAYGSNDQEYGGYGFQTSQKPNDPYNKPFYGSNQGSYGNTQGSYGSNHGSYGNSQNSYGDDGRPSYENNQDGYGAQKPKKPIKPSYFDDHGSYGSNQGSYTSSEVYDSHNSYGGSHSHIDQDYGSNRPSYGSQVTNSGYGGQKPTYGNQRPGNQTNYSGYPDRPDIKPVYEYELDKPSNVPSYIAKPGGDVVTSRPVVIGDYGEAGYRNPGKEPLKACFRRVLAGRRALRSHVRKVVPCERLEDCQKECVTERRFPCESFNYRLDPLFRGKGLCELMTKPIEAFDLQRDFIDDKDYDFYELDRNSLEPNCPESIRGPGLLHSGFLSSKPNRVPGLEHQSGWRDRIDWQENRYHRDYNYNRYYDERRGVRNYGHRQEDQFYVPYQIGLSRSNDDKENWGQYGGYYGGYDTYYKDRNDYHKSVNHWRLTSDREIPSYGVKPHGFSSKFDYHSLGKKDGLYENHRYGHGAWKRGRWNTSVGSWNGLNYEEASFYKSKPHSYEPLERSDEPIAKDCSSRRRPGMSLGTGAIRRSLLARNVVECEAACFSEREFKCVSYSYRYSSSRLGSDNCFLSERPYRGLEMSADSGSDVYAMPQDQGCATINHKPWVESECFWHVRSGATVSGSAVRAGLTVAGLGACEAECIRAHGFFCRGFSFRFDSPTIGDELHNCILTSSPPTSLETGRGLRPNSAHELYARGNYGRGCEPALYDDVHHRETECYLQYDSAAKLSGAAVRGQARVKDEQACGAACTEAPFRCLSFSYNNNAPPDTDNCLLSEIRLFDLQRGVDYIHSKDDWLFAFDLFNGQCWRKVHGKGEYEEPSPELPRPLPAPADDPYPVSGPSGPGYLPEPPPEPSYVSGGLPSELGYKPYPSGPEVPNVKPGYSPGSGSDYKPFLEPEYKPIYSDSIPYRPGYAGTGKPGYLPESFRPGYRPEPDHSYKPSYRPSNRPDFKPGYVTIEDNKPEYSPEHVRPYPVEQSPGYGTRKPATERPVYLGDRENEPIEVSWRHYTVSGFPCRAGTSCAQNQVAGHWACEPEGGEIGSWDYCCAPTHRCGYSEGFHKPWCYVGPTEDQWRPCSEKYYPYHQHKGPHPSQGHRENHPRPSQPWNDRPSSSPSYIPDRGSTRPGPYLSETDRKYWDELYKNGPQAYYDKYGNPLPGYTRVPTADRPYIKYKHSYSSPGTGYFVPLSALQTQELDPPVPGGLGIPRFWPVAYLHKEPPPNTTYFRYNETKPTTTTEKYTTTPLTLSRELPFESRDIIDQPNGNSIDKSHRDDKKRNISDADDVFQVDLDKLSTTVKTVTTELPMEEEKDNLKSSNYSEVETIKPESVKINLYLDSIKGIDDKLVDFSRSIEVLDIEDAKKGEKISDLRTLEAEERQIEAIGRLLATRRGGKLVLEKRSQKDLETKNIAVDKDLVDFNFGNRFPTAERRGVIKKVSKDELEREINMDRSLEVSETTFVRPPRVLTTTDNIRKAIVNGKVFYDATIREQRDIFSNFTRKSKNLRLPEDSRSLSVITTNNFGKKVIKARNVNPVRRVRRVYKKRYNPEEVRRRLLERDRSMKQDNVKESTRKH